MIPILRIAACLLGRFGVFDNEYIGRGRLLYRTFHVAHEFAGSFEYAHA